MTENVIILGSGPAGLSAAIYASREGFDPLLISGPAPGGQLTLTTVVENYPGFADGIMGPELMENMRKQAERFGTRFIEGIVTKVELEGKMKKVYVGEEEFDAKAIIIATGASTRWLGIDSEKKFIGKGVSSCATCDAPFFKNKRVVVVGGGDTAMEDSLFLTKFAASVTIIHRRDEFRASKAMAKKVLENSKINVIWNSKIDEILGEAKVNGVKIRNINTDEATQMPIDGVFVAIGNMPNTDLFKNQLELDDAGYIKTNEEVLTAIEGVFVAGDVADRIFKQAATAAGSGVKAALKVREYLNE